MTKIRVSFKTDLLWRHFKKAATSVADPINLLTLHFPIFAFKLSCLIHIEKKIIDGKMTQLNSKKVIEVSRSFNRLNVYWIIHIGRKGRP